MSRKHFSWLLFVTFIVAMAVLLVPGKTGRESSFEQARLLPGLAEVESAPLVLPRRPAPSPTTSTETVHTAPAAMIELEALGARLITLVPGTAVTVVFGQSVNTLAGLATTMPSGRLSVKLGLNAAEVFKLLSMVNVSVLCVPTATRLSRAALALLMAGDVPDRLQRKDSGRPAPPVDPKADSDTSSQLPMTLGPLTAGTG